MRAAWWWIDRWRKSSAYTGLTLEEQGAYRNLLDELWLRDGVLPKDDRALGNISGDARRWPKVRAAVLGHFYEAPDGWRNRTHDAIMSESKRLSEKQARYRRRNKGGNVTGNVTGDVTRSPSPSPSGSYGAKTERDGARLNGAPSPPSRDRIAKAVSDACRVGIDERRAREMLDARGIEAVERANAAGLACPVRMDGVDTWFDAVRA